MEQNSRSLINQEFINKQVQLYKENYQDLPMYIAIHFNSAESVEDLDFIRELFNFYTLESHDSKQYNSIEQTLCKTIDNSMYDFICNWMKEDLIVILDYNEYHIGNIKVLGMANINYNQYYFDDEMNQEYDYVKHCIFNNDILRRYGFERLIKSLRMYQLAIHTLDINKPDLIFNINASYVTNNKVLLEYQPIRTDYGMMLNNIHGYQNVTEGYDFEHKFYATSFRPEHAFILDDEVIKFIIHSDEESIGINYREKPTIMNYSIDKMMKKRQELCYRVLSKNHQLVLTYSNADKNMPIGVVEYGKIDNSNHIYLYNLFIRNEYNNTPVIMWILSQVITNLNCANDTGAVLHYRTYKNTLDDNILKLFQFMPVSYTLKISDKEDTSLFGDIF